MSNNLKQILAAELMAQGRNNRSVAEEIGVAEETISRWKREPEFQELVRQKSEEILTSIRQKSLGLYLKAVEHTLSYFDSIIGSNEESAEIALKILKTLQPSIQTNDIS